MKELKTYLIEFNDQSSLEATGNLYLFTDRSAALPLKRDDLIYLNANRVQSIIEVDKKKETSEEGLPELPTTNDIGVNITQKAAKENLVELLTDYDISYIDHNISEDEYSVSLVKKIEENKK